MDEADRVVASNSTTYLARYLEAGRDLPSFEPAGPRRALFFDPKQATCAIVTCGGLCPGQNDVIRSIVLTLKYGYGVDKVLGFRYGYGGLAKAPLAPPIQLSQELVDDIHQEGGTLLASSRGAPSVGEMVDTLAARRIDVLFTIGGDGTLRGAQAIAQEVARRKLKIAVVAVPKTIDNDLLWVARSFGFATAVEEARRAIRSAHAEARGAWNGIGLVKLMGRHSGFIAAHASLANSDVNFCLIPEVPFDLGGDTGFLRTVERRLQARRHAVIVVAEGAAQDLLQDEKHVAHDASGNLKLKDVGVFLKDQLGSYFAERQIPVTIKYIDPSYLVRSLAANSLDSEFCLMLGQHAVHAAMAGRTEMLVGYWNQRFTHAPIRLAVEGRKQIDPEGDVWQAVLEATGQPPRMGARGMA